MFSLQQTGLTRCRHIKWRSKNPETSQLINLVPGNAEYNRHSVALNCSWCQRYDKSWKQSPSASSFEIIFSSVQHWSQNVICFFKRRLKALPMWHPIIFLLLIILYTKAKHKSLPLYQPLMLSSLQGRKLKSNLEDTHLFSSLKARIVSTLNDDTVFVQCLSQPAAPDFCPLKCSMRNGLLWVYCIHAPEKRPT